MKIQIAKKILEKHKFVYILLKGGHKNASLSMRYVQTVDDDGHCVLKDDANKITHIDVEDIAYIKLINREDI